MRGLKGNDNRVSMEGEWEIFCESYLWSKVLVFIAYYINQVQTREKTFSNKEKASLPLIQWATKLRKVNWKMMFMLIWVIVDRRLQQFLLIRKKFFLFSSKIIQNVISHVKLLNSCHLGSQVFIYTTCRIFLLWIS